MGRQIATDVRIQWIDIAKAIGLIFIITGHFTMPQYAASKYVYWFHVPLFFMLSGMLHKQDIPAVTFIQARFKHLMVPYLFFLFVCLLLKPFGFCNTISTTNLLLGGIYLSEQGSRILMKWWFIPCLFATQVAALFILKIRNYKLILCIVLISYWTSIIIEWKYTVFFWGVPAVLFKLPLSLEIVPMSLVFYVIGFYCKKKFLTNDYNNNLNLLLLFLLVSIILLDYNGVITIPYYDMYRQHYGFPVFNLIMPIICFILVRSVSLLISKIIFIKYIFTAMGRLQCPLCICI